VDFELQLFIWRDAPRPPPLAWSGAEETAKGRKLLVAGPWTLAAGRKEQESAVWSRGASDPIERLCSAAHRTHGGQELHARGCSTKLGVRSCEVLVLLLFHPTLYFNTAQPVRGKYFAFYSTAIGTYYISY